MNTYTSLPASRMQRIMQLPLTQLLAGLLIVFLPVAIAQTFILSLPISGLLRGAVVVAVTLPLVYAAYYVLVHFIERREITELSAPGAVRETAQGLAIGAVLFGSIMALLALAGTFKIVGMNHPGVLLAPLMFAVSSAVFEEIFFRGVLFRLIERGLGSWIALAISAAAFGGLHLMNENATVIGALAIMLQAGIAMGAAFMMTRRLWLPIGIHLAVNFAQSGIIGTAVSGNEAGQGLMHAVFVGPDWLTGGVFGVEASIVTVAVGLAVSLAFIWRAGQKGNIR